MSRRATAERVSAPTPAEPSSNRDAILAASLRVLVEDGLRALTVRRVATEAGCSTIGVYTWFGGKDGLVDAIWIDGFRSFAAALRRAAKGKTGLESIVSQARAYRKWALGHPMHYRVMFLGAIAGHQPGPDAVAVASVAFELIHGAVSSATDDGELVNDDVEAMTMALWGLAHGLVSLELLGGRPSSLQKSKRLEDRAFDVAIEVALRGMTP